MLVIIRTINLAPGQPREAPWQSPDSSSTMQYNVGMYFVYYNGTWDGLRSPMFFFFFLLFFFFFFYRKNVVLAPAAGSTPLATRDNSLVARTRIFCTTLYLACQIFTNQSFPIPLLWGNYTDTHTLSCTRHKRIFFLFVSFQVSLSITDYYPLLSVIIFSSPTELERR